MARFPAGAGSRFVDRTALTVSSGSGGNGAVSFRREKYVPRGGPDGGDGGRGGDVLFVVRRNVHTLAHLAGRHHYRAENGAPGGRRRRHGAAGKAVRIAVPPGTVVRDAAGGQVLHTTETGWITNLLLTTYLGRTQEGRDFMNIRYPTDEFTSEAFIDAVRMVERLYAYTTADAIGGTYALAANHFSASDTAMIANGPWMIASFSDTQYSPEGFENKVGYARFPNDMMISNLGREYGRGVSLDHELEVREGAVEWIKFLATRDNIAQQAVSLGFLSHLVPLTDAEKQGLSPVNLEYFNAVEGVELTIPWFQAQWDPINQNETIVNQLPALLYGEITAQEYAAMLAASAKEYHKSL